MWTKKENKGHFIKLGQENQKNPDFNRTVELVVKDGEGNVISTHTDPFLTLLDPRQGNYPSQNVPENLVYEVFVSDN